MRAGLPHVGGLISLSVSVGVYITLKEARPYQAESLPIVGDQIQCEAVQMVVAWPGQG